MYFKLFAFLLCLSYAACAPSEECANTTVYSRNVRMEVSGCESNADHCPLYRGTNHTVTFTFVPTMNFKNTTDSRVYGVFEKFSVPYGKRGDACQLSVATDDGSECTSIGGFEIDREYKHTSKFAVSNNYPLLKLRVKFVFYDRRSKLNLMCQEVPVEIMRPLTEENETK
jgi:hypothetical protein